MKLALSILVLITLTSSMRAQVRFSPDERRIITITDERRDADSLIPYLSSPVTKVARRAAIGLANIGDTTVRYAIVERLMQEKRDSVADAEAFAIGLLGISDSSFTAMMQACLAHPTTERLKALARVAGSEHGAAAAKLPGKLADDGKINHFTEIEAYLELALNKAKTSNSRMMDDVEALAGDDDPRVRWRAAYVFARFGDSLDLQSRHERLKELLNDQGSVYARMFAATAIGRIHDAAAETLLYRAYRSEEDWRVRVNLLNAFARFPELDSSIFITLVRAVYGAVPADPLSIHVGLTAQGVLEQFVRGRKIPAPLMAIVRSWLNGFSNPESDGLHPDIPRIVQAASSPSATMLATPADTDAIKNYGQARDLMEREYSVRAMGSTDNVGYFGNLLQTMTYVSPIEQLWRLEALDSMWQRAKREPAFRAALEANHFANVYRYLLIRVSDVVNDPAVVTTALEHVKDSTIINDTLFRHEADRYMAKYLSAFCDQEHRDQLLAAMQVVSYLDDTSDGMTGGMLRAGKAASSQEWCDREIADSAWNYLTQRMVWEKPPFFRCWHHVSNIDWKYLESLPEKITINLDRGSIELRLLTDNAPLTVLNMVRLAKGQYFTNQKVHRVVPNFVIQSGDPTGTGWGGPGYMIRSEFTPMEYDREGVTGMARDGKDTEGSQWFITHCPTPNLDARYTIWAEVTGGMNTVMAVQRGDKVQTVIAHR